MGDDPWMGVNRRYPQGTRMFGKITNIADYGAFVELEPGIEGLVHVSEMDWTNKNIAPSKLVTLGDEVEVMILEIDEERRRISLGMKQCKPNPWDDFAMNHKKGDKVRGAIKSITDFGIFIGLPGNIDGLVHLSDLSWSAVGEEAVRNFKKGDEIETVILAIDPERVTWRRVLDVNDRSLRRVRIGLGGSQNGVERETGFDITPASEVMAVLGLSTGLADMRARLGRMVLGRNRSGKPVTADDLQVIRQEAIAKLKARKAGR